jgi:hypothetical protein
MMAAPTAEFRHFLRHDVAVGLVFNRAAADALDSYAYLVTECSKAEAWRRIMAIRAALALPIREG